MAHRFSLACIVLAAVLILGCGDGRSGGAGQNNSGGGPSSSGEKTLSRADHPQAVVVLVAASTKDAVEEITDRFGAEHGVNVKVSAGPSNTLAAQILAGAPADLFLSANEQWADAVQDKGLARTVEPLLTNDLVLVVSKGNPARVTKLDDLATGNVKKLALAGENVPASMYAQQALSAANLYQSLVDEGRIARGQDVRVALSYVERGEAEAGIVYSTDAKISEQVEVVLTFDPATYDKIVYPLVLLAHADENDAARKLFDDLQSDAAAGVFEKHGFARLKRSE